MAARYGSLMGMRSAVVAAPLVLLAACSSAPPPPSPAASSPAAPAATPTAAPAAAASEPTAEAPAPRTGTRPALTAGECEARGGRIIGDPGNGATLRPGYRCPDSDEAPTGRIKPEPEGPRPIEGAVCCPRAAEGAAAAP